MNIRFVSFMCSGSTKAMFVRTPPNRYKLAWLKGMIAIRGLSHINRVLEGRVLDGFSATHSSCVAYLVTHSTHTETRLVSAMSTTQPSEGVAATPHIPRECFSAFKVEPEFRLRSFMLLAPNYSPKYPWNQSTGAWRNSLGD